MNNAGTMETGRHITEDGLERTVSVNYVAPYLLTRKLIPLMEKGSRIVKYGVLYLCHRGVSTFRISSILEREEVSGAFLFIAIRNWL